MEQEIIKIIRENISDTDYLLAVLEALLENEKPTFVLKYNNAFKLLSVSFTYNMYYATLHSTYCYGVDVTLYKHSPEKLYIAINHSRDDFKFTIGVQYLVSSIGNLAKVVELLLEDKLKRDFKESESLLNQVRRGNVRWNQ